MKNSFSCLTFGLKILPIDFESLEKTWGVGWLIMKLWAIWWWIMMWVRNVRRRWRMRRLGESFRVVWLFG